MLYCEACSDEPDEGCVRKPGVFAYNFSLGSEFQVHQPMPEKFKSLKAAVSGHYISCPLNMARLWPKAGAKEKEVARLLVSADVASRVLCAANNALKKVTAP